MKLFERDLLGMRVLYVTGNSYLRSTTTSLDAIIRALKPAGLEPVMLFREPGPWPQVLAAGGVPCYYHPLRAAEKSRPLRSLADAWRLVRLIRRERIDLIHCSEHEIYPALRLAARWARRPVVVTLHYKLEPSFGCWLFRSPYMPAAIQFISRAQLDYCRPALPPEITPDRIKLLMSGLAVDSFRGRGDNGAALRADWRTDVDTVVIGTASAIRPYKHLDQFVHLIGRLRARGLNVLGVVAGGGRFADPTYEAGLLALIDQLGLKQSCRMLGNLEPLTPFLKAIDLFVSTSEWETFAMSISEAQACGKPTLAYAVGGNPEAVPDAWCLAPFGDLNALEKKAAHLVTDADSRRDMGQRAEAFIRANFDAPALAARQAAIYETVLGRPSGLAVAPSLTAAGCPT